MWTIQDWPRSPLPHSIQLWIGVDRLGYHWAHGFTWWTIRKRGNHVGSMMNFVCTFNWPIYVGMDHEAKRCLLSLPQTIIVSRVSSSLALHLIKNYSNNDRFGMEINHPCLWPVSSGNRIRIVHHAIFRFLLAGCLLRGWWTGKDRDPSNLPVDCNWGRNSIV